MSSPWQLYDLLGWQKEPEELGEIAAAFCQLHPGQDVSCHCLYLRLQDTRTLLGQFMGLITLETGSNYTGNWVSLAVSTCWNAAGVEREPSKVLCVRRGWMESPGVIADITLCGCIFVALGLSPSPVSCWVSRCPVTAASSNQVISYLDTKGGIKQWGRRGEGTPLPWGWVLGALNSSE